MFCSKNNIDMYGLNDSQVFLLKIDSVSPLGLLLRLANCDREINF